MTSPSAQKAADGLKEMLLQKGELSRHEVADLFQQAITEAVDAAVAQERAKCLKLAAEWNQKSMPEHNDYIDVSAEKRTYERCAEELESLVKEK